MVGKSLCVVKVVPRGWKGKIFYVQPAVPNTLIALHRRYAWKRRNRLLAGVPMAAEVTQYTEEELISSTAKHASSFFAE
jgi:hypothetical protein